MIMSSEVSPSILKEEEIEIDKIDPPLFSLRNIDEEFLKELMDSIKGCGLLQPILVRESENRFVVIAGAHRLEACKRLGWKKIRALVVKCSPEESFLLQLVENLQRNIKINVVAEAKGYKWLIEKGWSLNQIAEKIGKSVKYVSARIRIVEKLHPHILGKLSHGKYRYLTPSHAEQLALINDHQKQLELARIIEEEKLSVRELEKLTQIVTQNEQKLRNEVPSTITTEPNSMNGELLIAGLRVGAIPGEVLTRMVGYYRKKGGQIGRELGRLTRKIMLGKKNNSLTPKNSFILFLSTLLGLGKFHLDDEKLIVEKPIIKNCCFLKGWLEGLLNLGLTLSYSDENTYLFYLNSYSPRGEI